MSRRFRLATRAFRVVARVGCVGAFTAMATLGLAGCEAEEPAPLIATPSAIEVAVMEAVQEASPSPTAEVAEPARGGTARPTARAPAPPVPRPVVAVPTAPATPAATPALPLEPLDDAAIGDRLGEAAGLIEGVTGSPAALRAGADLRAPLEAAVLAFLERYGADREAAARLDHTIGQLPPLVYDLEPTGARIAVADVDGDGANELVAAWHIIGAPPVWFDQTEEGFVAREFPTGALGETAPSMSVVHSTADVTGDGVADVVLVSTAPGRSTQTETVRVFAWNGEAPRRVFDMPVVLGAGPAGWEVRDGASPAEIETMCPALGHFDAPLLPHPGLRRTFAWDGQFFEEVGRRLDGPVSPHDQINRAEAAFWAGRYEEAAAGYRAAIEDPVDGGSGTGSQPDWEGLAYLRLAQIGLVGGEALNPAWLQAAIERGGEIGLIAGAMQEAVATLDPMRTFAALQQVDLTGTPPPGVGGSIGFPMDAGLVLALGKALEIGLRGVGGGELSEAAITSRLSSRGVEVRRAAVGDLNSDGALEAVVSLTRLSTRVVGPPVNDFWFVYRHGTRWVAQPLEPVSDSAFPIAVKSVSEGRAVITITDTSAGTANYLSFDGRRTVVWDELPTLEDLYPVNPFDGRGIRSCEVGG
ncbi:MAG: VCBS repeat-containing protein [Chloroflexota bacterium]|nr:VCBS repeat-containing protein [Chloroflexota bacterium]